MSTTDTVIDPRVSGGVYATGGREYRLVYVWPTDDLSVIWAGTDSAVVIERWPWGGSDTVIYSPGLEDLKRLEANLADAVKEAEQITAAAAAASVADVEAVTDSGALTDLEAERLAAGLAGVRGQVDPFADSEADAPSVSDAYREALVGLDTGTVDVAKFLAHLADTDQGAGQSAADREATTLTGQVGTGKAIHEIRLDDVTRLGDAQAGDAVTSWCGKTGLLSKPGATITCKRCQKA